MDFILGDDRNQIILFPESIDDFIGEENPVRVMDAFVEQLALSELGFVKASPNSTGRPMYSPKDMLKLCIYGYMNRIRSSRRLETETKRNLEVMWLLGKLSPDHKTIARFRHENGSALKNVFKDFVKLCLHFNLYGKELIAVDGSKFKAVNSKDRNFTDKKLQERIARLEVKIEEYMNQLNDMDKLESTLQRQLKTKEINNILKSISSRKTLYESYAKEIKESNDTQKSLTDPDSRLMMANGKMDVCYNVQSAVDDKHNLVVDFEVTTFVQDKNWLSPMAENAAQIMGVQTLQAVADADYDSVNDIAKCISAGITPHVAGNDFDLCMETDSDQSEAIISHNKGRCTYHVNRNIVLCPMGKVLYPKYYRQKIQSGIFYNYAACKQCECKCTVERYKKHQVAIKEEVFTKNYNDAGLFVKQIHIKADKKIIPKRKAIVEHPFGILKRAMDSGYCLTRRIKNVSGEFSLSFLAFNMKRVINIMGVANLLKALQH